MKAKRAPLPEAIEGADAGRRASRSCRDG
jgi:hypothetical protein